MEIAMEIALVIACCWIVALSVWQVFDNI